MTIAKKTLTILALTTAPLAAMAQNGINTPYSRYGLGVLSDRSMGFNKAMGGVAQGFRHGQEINPANPASYAAIDSLTALFDLGMSIQNGNYHMAESRQNIRNSSFDYIAYSFRATRGLGITVALLPYSKIKYETSSSNETYSGDGGLRQVMLGAGWQVLRPLSIGLNVGYLWGEYEHNATAIASSTSEFSTKRTYTANISTYTLEFGAQYMINLHKQQRLTLGATGKLGHIVNNTAKRITSTLNSSAVVASTEVGLSDAFQLPFGVAAGASYQLADKLRAGLDFEYEGWSHVRFPVAKNYDETEWTPQTGVLNDRFRVSAGVEYTPNTMGKFLQRIQYKVGGYWSRSYANANESISLTNKKPTEFGLSAGFSIPIQNRNLFYSSPKVNITFSWVHANIPYFVGNTSKEGALKENYLRLSLGLTLSERWFYKWKVQ